MEDDLPWLIFAMVISLIIGNAVFWEVLTLTKTSRTRAFLVAMAMVIPFVNLITIVFYIWWCARHELWRKMRKIRVAYLILAIIGFCLFCWGYGNVDQRMNWLEPQTGTMVEETANWKLPDTGGEPAIMEHNYVQTQYTGFPIVIFFVGYNFGFLCLALGLGVGSTYLSGDKCERG